jgi:hypothetical protein
LVVLNMVLIISFTPIEEMLVFNLLQLRKFN